MGILGMYIVQSSLHMCSMTQPTWCNIDKSWQITKVTTLQKDLDSRASPNWLFNCLTASTSQSASQSAKDKRHRCNKGFSWDTPFLLPKWQVRFYFCNNQPPGMKPGRASLWTAQFVYNYYIRLLCIILCNRPTKVPNILIARHFQRQPSNPAVATIKKHYFFNYGHYSLLSTPPYCRGYSWRTMIAKRLMEYGSWLIHMY